MMALIFGRGGEVRPAVPSCRCGLPFRRAVPMDTMSGQVMVYFWCAACDGHGSGCTDRNHPPDKACTYP